jgi:hypothetical protein
LGRTAQGSDLADIRRRLAHEQPPNLNVTLFHL